VLHIETVLTIKEDHRGNIIAYDATEYVISNAAQYCSSVDRPRWIRLQVKETKVKSIPNEITRPKGNFVSKGSHRMRRIEYIRTIYLSPVQSLRCSAFLRNITSSFSRIRVDPLRIGRTWLIHFIKRIMRLSTFT